MGKFQFVQYFNASCGVVLLEDPCFCRNGFGNRESTKKVVDVVVSSCFKANVSRNLAYSARLLMLIMVGTFAFAITYVPCFGNNLRLLQI